MYSLEEIKDKLGFDPFNSHRDNNADPWAIVDRPSPYSVLTDDELDFLIAAYQEKKQLNKHSPECV